MRAPSRGTRTKSAADLIEVHARVIDGGRRIALVVGLPDVLSRGPDLAGLGQGLAALLEPALEQRLAALVLHARDLDVGRLVEVLDLGLVARGELDEDVRAGLALEQGLGGRAGR